MSAAFGGVFAGRRVLITGHTGFKGAWLAWWLRQLGAKVAGVSLPILPSVPSLYDALNLGDEITDLRFDLTDADRVAEAIGACTPEVIFHLAAQSLVRRGYSDPLETVRSNVIGTANVLEAMRSSPSVRSAVIVSTDKIYRNEERGNPFHELDPLQGNDPYSASKAGADMVAAAWAALPGMPPITIVRAGNVVGGGDWGEDRLMSDLMGACVLGKVAMIRNPASVRPWQDVRDCLAGYLRVAQLQLVGEGGQRDIYNFGPDKSGRHTVAEVADVAVRAFGRGGWLEVPGPPELPEAALLALDSSRAQERLGWRPVWSVLEAVERAAEWYRDLDGGASARDLCDGALDAHYARAVRAGLGWLQASSV